MATTGSLFSEINFGFKQLQMSDWQSSPQEGPGSRRKPWTYGHPWTYHPGYWGPSEPRKEPYYEPYGPPWGPPPRGPPPNYNYQNYQGNQAQSASHGKPKTQIASKSSAQSGPKKRKVAEVALVSLPKAGSATASSRPIKSSKQNPPTQAMQLQAAKRMGSGMVDFGNFLNTEIEIIPTRNFFLNAKPVLVISVF